jgi:O-antigen/teichoic acid export membrane protein
LVKTGFLNIALRLLSSVSRLVLFLGLARYLPVEDVGRFGLLFATIQIVLSAGGLEFHQFATRSLLDHPESHWARMLRDQAVVHGMAYAVLLPLSAALFVTGVLTAELAFWFYPLLLVEHGCQELQRLMVTRSRPLRSNWILFARSGLWVWPIVIAMAVWPTTRDLWFVWIAWLAGGLGGLWIGVLGLRDLVWRDALTASIDRAWIRSGLRVAVPYLAAVVAFRGITTVDRYLLAHLADQAAVGVYVLFFGIVNTMVTLTESGVVMVLAPVAVRSARGRDPALYRQTMRRVTIGVAGLAAAGALTIAVFVDPLLRLVGKDVFTANLAVCWMLLAAAVVTTLGLIPNLVLYAARQDRPIVLAAVAGLATASIANVVLIPGRGAFGAAAATFAGMAVVSGTKAVAAVRWNRTR